MSGNWYSTIHTRFTQLNDHNTANTCVPVLTPRVAPLLFIRFVHTMVKTQRKLKPTKSIVEPPTFSLNMMGVVASYARKVEEVHETENVYVLDTNELLEGARTSSLEAKCEYLLSTGQQEDPRVTFSMPSHEETTQNLVRLYYDRDPSCNDPPTYSAHHVLMSAFEFSANATLPQIRLKLCFVYPENPAVSCVHGCICHKLLRGFTRTALSPCCPKSNRQNQKRKLPSISMALY